MSLGLQITVSSSEIHSCYEKMTPKLIILLALAFLIYFIFLSECFYIRSSSRTMAVYYSVSGPQDHEWMCLVFKNSISYE